jgi:2,6-dihydroxypseudooxynicotine hydrolase
MVDERVQSAIANWAPRFIANGVDPNDYQRVTARIQSWDGWMGEWTLLGAVYEGMAEAAMANRHYETAAEQFFHAAMAYHFGKFLAVAFPERLRDMSDRVVRCYQSALPWFATPGERIEIYFSPGSSMPGILRKPAYIARPPVVILIPGLDSVKEELHNYSDDFLRRGMATLAIDGPGQGEMEFTSHMRADYEFAIAAAIDALEQRADVDAEHIGLLGVSLGGYYAARAAAFEPRVRAAISLAGPYDVAAAFAQAPELTQAAFITRCGATTHAAARERLQPFTLSGVAERITCPLLVIMGRQDRVIPPADAERLVQAVPGPVDLWLFDDGNHVCNNIPNTHRPQQADWMRQRLQTA